MGLLGGFETLSKMFPDLETRLSPWIGNPDSPLASIAIECKLSHPGVYDLGYCIRRGGTFGSWLDRGSETPHPAFRLAADPRIRWFLAEWGDAETLVGKFVDNLWIEQDFHSQGGYSGSFPGINFTVAPGWFNIRNFAPPRKFASTKEEQDLFTRVGAHWMGCPEEELRSLWRVHFEPLQSLGSLLYYSFLPGRAEPQCKVYALVSRKAAEEEMQRFGVDMEWRRHLDAWLPGSDPLTVERSIGVNKGTRKLGLEILSGCQNQHPTRYELLLRGLSDAQVLEATWERMLRAWTQEERPWYMKLNFHEAAPVELKFYFGCVL